MEPGVDAHRVRANEQGLVRGRVTKGEPGGLDYIGELEGNGRTVTESEGGGEGEGRDRRRGGPTGKEHNGDRTWRYICT